MTNSIEPYPTDAAIIRSILIDSMNALLPKMTLDLARMIESDYSDDDTDYFPARACTYSNLAAALISHDEFALTYPNEMPQTSNAIILLASSDDFLADLSACDFELAIDQFFLSD